MSRPPTIENLASELRAIAARSPLQAEAEIERFLGERLEPIPPAERLEILEALCRRFEASEGGPEGRSGSLDRVVALLLGGRIPAGDLPPEELLRRLADSLHTVFDSLNRLVRVIHAAFAGESDPQQTIHQVIGDHLKGDDRLKALENYIGQISRAFLFAQQAFQAAASKTVQKLLRELDPKRLGDENGKGLRFGPLKKADLYDAYEQKYQQCRKWVENGKFAEHLMREVERAWRQKTTTERRRPKGGSR